MYNFEINVYDWLNYFSMQSKHWIFKYWKNKKDIFFDRFVVIGDYRLLIIADKEKICVYEFKKPQEDVILQLNMEI